MTFTKRDKYHAVSECGRYTINKAGQGPGRVVYMAVLDAPPRSKILGTWRCADEPGDRAAAYREAIAACENHANGIPA
jgi:hypothetical protein